MRINSADPCREIMIFFSFISPWSSSHKHSLFQSHVALPKTHKNIGVTLNLSVLTIPIFSASHRDFPSTPCQSSPHATAKESVLSGRLAFHPYCLVPLSLLSSSPCCTQQAVTFLQCKSSSSCSKPSMHPLAKTPSPVRPTV